MACTNAATAAMQLGQMGIHFDIEAYMEERAKLRYQPILKRLFYFTPAQGGEPAPMGGGSAINVDKPNGNYTRRSVSERTNDGSLMELMQHTGAAEAPAMQ